MNLIQRFFSFYTGIQGEAQEAALDFLLPRRSNTAETFFKNLRQALPNPSPTEKKRCTEKKKTPVDFYTELCARYQGWR